MRLLFCESSKNLGGQELQILLQMEALGRDGELCVLACRRDSAIAKEATARDIGWRPVGFRNSLHLPSIAALRGLLREKRIDAAICSSGHDSNNLAIAARLLGRPRPVLVRARTYQPGVPKAISYNHLVDRTLVNSEHLRRRILANPRIRPERIAVLRPMVPVDQIRQQAGIPLPEPLQAALAGRGPLIVHAAMLRPEKGHRIVLDVIGKLCLRYPKLRYVVAGSGPEERALREMVEARGLQDMVHFAGLVIPVAPLLARADLVIMPSLDEPLGLAQVEALALGVPVAVSDAGGLSETVSHRETGWVLPAGDTPSWEEGLAEALADPERARGMARQGRRFVEQTFAPAAHLACLRRQLDLARAARWPRTGPRPR